MEEHIKTMLPLLNEKQRRLFLASLANQHGKGGLKKVCNISGYSPHTVIKAKKELQQTNTTTNQPNTRIRKQGGGRKKLETQNPNLPTYIEQTITDQTYGNPQKTLKYTTKSLRNIQQTLQTNHQTTISFKTIATILKKLDYSLQGNKKMLQIGQNHPDRNQQFEFINQTAQEFIEKGDPVISVDTKKKELIGNYANKGQEYRPKKTPRLTFDHDFPIGEMLKVAPYGVYVLNDNSAFVNLGTSRDTGEFAAFSISRWWDTVGKHTFPLARRLFVTCDCGGSNGYRNWLWKVEMQELANRCGLVLYVSHFPPGTSKWNKVEHRLFCFISKNWAGRPLVDVETVVSLISNTVTRSGLRVVCLSDERVYLVGRKVSDVELGTVNISKVGVHGEWNYIISPKT